MAPALILFSISYLVALFPFAYFRHDDWMMIENGARLPADWSAVWKVTLISGEGTEMVWFFRPLFKFLNYLFYSAFGLNYWPWLLFQLACTLGAVWTAGRLLEGLTGRRSAGVLFAVLFAASLQLHVGSLVWVGEGLMNCPLILLLSLNAYCFHRAWTRGGPGAEAAAVLFLVLALGLKEAAIFQTVLLAAFVWCEEPWRSWGWRRRSRALAPYFALGLAYTMLRIGLMPLNHGYHVSLGHVLPSLGLLGGTLLLPVLTLGLFSRLRDVEELRRRWPYGIFLALTVAPYVGHDFFSPGWLLVPGYFLLFVCSLPPWERKIPALGPVLALLCWGITLGRMHRQGWWEWHRAQRAAVAHLASLDGSAFDRLQIVECEEASPPGVSVERVVGGTWAFTHLWRLQHGAQIEVERIQSCGGGESTPPRTVRLRWRFPDVALKSP